MTQRPQSINTLEIDPESYVIVGLATWFVKQDNKLTPVKVAEPIASASLEAIAHGIETSYELAIATTVGAVYQEGQVSLPPEFPAGTELGEAFAERLQAAARSFRSRPEAQSIIPLGQVKRDFNYSTERKRMLNADRVVNTEDNVKQHAYTHQVL